MLSRNVDNDEQDLLMDACIAVAVTTGLTGADASELASRTFVS
jgi:hypothetical protein